MQPVMCSHNGRLMVFSVERVPDQAGEPACSSGKAWREGFGFRKETIANLAMLPDHVAGTYLTLA